MKAFRKNSGFSTLEVLTAVAIIAILLTIFLGVGKGLRTQAEEKLTATAITTITTALEQYYDFANEFPFVANTNYDEVSLLLDIGSAAGGTVTFVSGIHASEWSSSEALFFFLDRIPNCRETIASVSRKLITNKDESGDNLIITDDLTGTNNIDLIRFIDPWGNALRYTYLVGDNFPLIKSTGVDGVPDTADDITSK